MDLAVSGHLMLLALTARRLGGRRLPRSLVQQVVLQEAALDQIVELVTQGQARIKGVTKTLVEFTPRVRFWSNTLSETFSGTLSLAAMLGMAIRSANPMTNLYLVGRLNSLGRPGPLPLFFFGS